MDLLMAYDKRFTDEASKRVSRLLADVQEAIDIVSKGGDPVVNVNIVTRPSKCETCHGSFNCSDMRGNHYSKPCPYGIAIDDCVIHLADPSRNRNNNSDDPSLSNLNRLAFLLNLYEARKKKGLNISDEKIKDIRASLLWVLVQYKVALEVQFQDYIEDNNVATL